MKIRVAINGFGRIGRNLFRLLLNHPNIEVVAINDIADIKTMSHLVKYDSIHGVLQRNISTKNEILLIDDLKFQFFHESDISKLPWKALNIDFVIEATGKFKTTETAQLHLLAGAKKVIISAPATGEDVTIVLGVNEDKYDPKNHHVVSNASCTTNCLAPFVKVLNDSFGVKRGMMTTVHSYTNDQQILDLPHKDLRRARAAAENIIPTTTGAAKAVGLVLPELQGKLNGFSLRVPTPNVSVTDLVAELDKSVTAEEINDALKTAAAGPMKGILDFSNEPLVSKDYNGNPHSSIVDGLSTMVIDGNMVKVVSWYDNEWGYSNRVVDLAVFMGKKGI